MKVAIVSPFQILAKNLEMKEISNPKLGMELVQTLVFLSPKVKSPN